ncbi:MAG: patatin-like phospholipase family protein [Gemmatimonadales bacterium]
MALFSLGLSPLVAQVCTPARTALVLSGGGVKGVAHIGLIRVLDSLGVAPDLVVGTSMGAIVGALYASGYSGRELDSLVRIADLEQTFQAYDLHGPQRLRGLSPLIIWERGAGGVELQNASVSEAAVNFLLGRAMMRGNLMARGDFDSLPIPYRAVATNLATRKPTVFARGDLAQVVRASMAVPVVFEPVEIDGAFFLDGGLSQNVPIAAARQAGATRLIISDVTKGTADSLNPYSAIAVGEQVINYLFSQDIDTLPGDVYIKIDLADVGTLDLDRGTVARVLEEGYRVADSAIGGGVCLEPRRPATVRPLPSVIGSVDSHDGSADEAARAAEVLRLETGDSFDLVTLRRRLAVLSETQWYRSIWLGPGGAGDAVSFDMQLRGAPRWVAGLAVAYNNDRGGKLWLGAVNRALFVQGLEGSAFLFLGRFRQELFAGLRNTKRLGSYGVTPTLSASGAFEDVRQFDAQGNEQPAIPVDELVGFLGLERRFHDRWSVAFGFEARLWKEADTSDRAAGGHLRVMRTTRNAEPRMVADIMATAVYRRVAVLLAPTFELDRWSLRPYARLGWGEGLPAQLQFPLGGVAGFPGLHVGERLGDREFDVGLIARHTIKGLVFVSGEMAVGRTAFGGGLIDGSGWLLGGRIGVGADTPFGPVGVDYGVTDGGRNLLLFRYGRWF